jgi:hypothetical protein
MLLSCTFLFVPQAGNGLGVQAGSETTPDGPWMNFSAARRPWFRSNGYYEEAESFTQYTCILRNNLETTFRPGHFGRVARLSKFQAPPHALGVGTPQQSNEHPQQPDNKAISPTNNNNDNNAFGHAEHGELGSSFVSHYTAGLTLFRALQSQCIAAA